MTPEYGSTPTYEVWPETDAIMAVLDAHRWKSMGVSSVECECGQILYGQGDDEPLTQFPADEAFRRHVAAEVLRAFRPGTSDEFKADGVREAADALYLTGPGQHHEEAKDWLHRRANLIDPRTRAEVCEHGNPPESCRLCAADRSTRPGSTGGGDRG